MRFLKMKIQGLLIYLSIIDRLRYSELTRSALTAAVIMAYEPLTNIPVIIINTMEIMHLRNNMDQGLVVFWYFSNTVV